MKTIMVAWTTAALLAGSPEPEAASVTELSVVPSGDRTEVVIAVDGAEDYRDFTMEGPARLVLDVRGAAYGLPDGEFYEVGRGGVRAVQASQYEDDVVRVVLELDHLVGYTVMMDRSYIRVSMENPSGTFEPWSSRAAMGTPGAAPRTETTASLQPVLPAVQPDARRPGSGNAGGRSAFRASEDSERITVSFSGTPIREVLFTFSEFTDRSIVPGSDVGGEVNADIRDQPWDLALQAILDSHGLAAQEAGSGIIRVDRMDNLRDREDFESLLTRSFRIGYSSASEFREPIESLLSERGRISVNQATNSLVVTDIPRVLESVEELLQSLDLRTPQITISAKIIFVNRTDLEEFGVVYDLKDSRGNQLNTIHPGGIDADGDGRISPDEIVERGTDVVSLGGNSIAALGNANQRVLNPSLEFLTSLILGRHTLLAFVEALQSVNLSDIQAAPQVSVLDNHQARILVGERTPIRVVDVGTGAGGQLGPPQATVQIEETGIMLEVTPHLTAGDLILMSLRAERSGIELTAEADVGFIFNTQEAETRVLVQDGETIVIGGLTVTERDEVRAGIPLLMNLPLVGRFFRLTREQKNQRDLMILVTPHIDRN